VAVIYRFIAMEVYRFIPKVVHVEFMVNKMALWEVFLRALRLYPASFISPMLHTCMSSVTGIVVVQRLQYQETHPYPTAVQVIGIPLVGLVSNMSHVCVISGFRHKVDENCALLGYNCCLLHNKPEECNSLVTCVLCCVVCAFLGSYAEVQLVCRLRAI
jgi:hypothetical protein